MLVFLLSFSFLLKIRLFKKNHYGILYASKRAPSARRFYMAEKEQSNIVLVQDEADKKSNRLTWAHWVKGIKHYKWWVIGSTALTAFAGFAGIEWGLNKTRERLVATYSYSLATDVDTNNVERYINGQLFDYTSAISKSTMEEVKNSNEAYSKINIDKIIKGNAISITRKTYDESTTNTPIVLNTRTVEFTISAKASVFPSDEIGKSFINDLINSPVNISTTAINNFNVTKVVTSNFENLSYNDRVTLLRQQQNAISDSYARLNKKFGDSVFANKDNHTLGQMISDFNVVNSQITGLLDSFYSNCYVDYVTGKEAEKVMEIKTQAEATVVALEGKEEKKKVMEDLLKGLESATIVSTLTQENEYMKEIIEMKNNILAISEEINELVRTLNWAGFYKNSSGKYVFDDMDTKNVCYKLEHLDPTWVENNTKYAASLTEGASTLERERDEATSIYRYVFSLYSNGVSIHNSGYVEMKNSIHWIIGLALGLVLGFAVSSFVVAEVEYYKSNKKPE